MSDTTARQVDDSADRQCDAEQRAVGRRKRRAALLSVGSNTTLVVSKLLVGVITGSVAIVSEAVHSAMDLVAAIIAFIAVSLSDRPPDASHPHGHGKIEDLSGAVEALLIFGAVVFIAFEAVDKLIHGGEVQRLYLGVAVMAASALVNTGVSWYLQRVGRQTDSAALLADAAHLRTDVYTSVGVVAGLLLVQFTGQIWLDPVVAMAVALLIVWEAWQITRRSVGELLDRGLPEEEQRVVERVIRAAGLSFHQLRSRKSGPTRIIDLHLDVSPKATVKQIHATCDEIERNIVQELPGAQVLIHPEPLLELDGTQTVEFWMTRILDQHRDLFRSYSDLHVHEDDDQMHISLRLQVDPGVPVREIHMIQRHLTHHVEQHVPDAHVYISPEPPDPTS